jgi:hypothetical protein
MNPDVLLNIKRHNISVDAMMALAPKVKEAGLRTHSEIILSLPGDTYEGYLQTIRDLINANVDFIKGYTLMLLPGSQLATPTERSKWGFVTKFRPLTMDFAQLDNGRRVIETEEVVVGSNTLSYNEYVDLRVLAFTLWIMTRGGYDALLKFCKEKGADAVELLLAIKRAEGAPARIVAVLEAFRQATIRELWDSPEQIEEHYQTDAGYQKLLQGEEGVNLLNYFGGIVTAEHIEEWTNYSIERARLILRPLELGPESWRQFDDVATYCRGVTFGLMDEDRLDHNLESELAFDIGRWLRDETGLTLDRFPLNPSRRVSFRLAQDQITLLTDLIDIYGNTAAGRGQALKYVPESMLWRHPVVTPDAA